MLMQLLYKGVTGVRTCDPLRMQIAVAYVHKIVQYTCLLCVYVSTCIYVCMYICMHACVYMH